MLLDFNVPGEHPAAMHHGRSSYSTSPAILVITCLFLLLLLRLPT